MTLHRRHFLAAGTAAIAAAAGYRTSPAFGRLVGPVTPIPDSDLQTFLQAALEAARNEGAQYADVVYRSTRSERWQGYMTYPSPPTIGFTGGVGVRALAGGSWGATGHDGALTMDDAVRLGREAAALAKGTAGSRSSVVTLVPNVPVIDGRWTTPIERDPFTVPEDEKLDFMHAMNDYVARLARDIMSVTSALRFRKVETTMASTAGASYAQAAYTTSGWFGLEVSSNCLQRESGYAFADFITPAGAGWEYIRSAPYRDAAPALLDAAFRQRGRISVEAGRHTVVFDAYAVASLLSATLGGATALDRAMGMTSGGVGTSFLSDPLQMLGEYRVGAPGVTITASRSTPKGAATVAWDDEGVAPRDVVLVKDGILTDFQTTRESAQWIAPYYARTGQVPRSSGAAGRTTPTAFMEHTPANLTLAPGRDTVSFDDLVRSTPKGYAICGNRETSMDWQGLNGVGYPWRMYRIENGRLGSAVDLRGGVHYQLRAPEFLKSVVAMGGKASAKAYGIEMPGTEIAHTVTAVPIKVTQLRVMGRVY